MFNTPRTKSAMLPQAMVLPRPRPYERQLSRDSTTGGAHSLPPLWEDSDLAAVRTLGLMLSTLAVVLVFFLTMFRSRPFSDPFII